jgi:hypothetical protein
LLLLLLLLLVHLCLGSVLFHLVLQGLWRTVPQHQLLLLGLLLLHQSLWNCICCGNACDCTCTQQQHADIKRWQQQRT